MKPNSEKSYKIVNGLAMGMLRMAQKLQKHAEDCPIANTRDIAELRSTAKLCLDVVNKSTTDPFLMAHIIKSMTKEEKSLLSDWMHQNNRMGK